MSAITFTTRDGQATVGGRERVYGATLAGRLTASVLDLDGRDAAARNRRILPASFFQHATLAQHQATREGRPFSLTDVFAAWAPLAAMFGEDVDLRIGDQRAQVSEVVTNTAIVGGSDPVTLLARIHASAEEGLFVDAPQRNWLAKTIETGVQTRILRANARWAETAEMLRTESGPVFITTEVSVSAMLGLAAEIYTRDQSDEQRWAAEETFESQSAAKQWDQTIDAVREARSGDRCWWLTLAQEHFHEPAYQDGLTAFDAIAAAADHLPAIH